MRIQSNNGHAKRGLDDYFSPPEAARSLLALESNYLPRIIREPAAGNGAISEPFLAAGYDVVSSDLADYGYAPSTTGIDYLTAEPLACDHGIVTNPPYRLALPFAEKALREARYLALLLRTNFLESTSRMPFFRRSPPTRVWVPSRRFPMMHKHGYAGHRSSSNTCHAWFVWDQRRPGPTTVGWFDYRDLLEEEEPMIYEVNAVEPARIAARIIRDHRPELAVLKICYMWREEAISLGDGRVCAGQCVHVSDRDYAIHGHDFLILFAQDVWAKADPQYKPAIVDHELAHVGIRLDEDGEPARDDDTGRLKTYCRHHDIEEFADVLERHGAYHRDLRAFLSAWGRSPTTPNGGDGERADPVQPSAHEEAGC